MNEQEMKLMQELQDVFTVQLFPARFYEENDNEKTEE